MFWGLLFLCFTQDKYFSPSDHFPLQVTKNKQTNNNKKTLPYFNRLIPKKETKTLNSKTLILIKSRVQLFQAPPPSIPDPSLWAFGWLRWAVWASSVPCCRLALQLGEMKNKVPNAPVCPTPPISLGLRWVQVTWKVREKVLIWMNEC